jgi:alpha-L-rhamnosidase
VNTAHHLRVEHLDTALGLHVRQPRLSWRLPEGTTIQRAYRIRTSNGWDTGRTDSPESILLPYAGPTLGSSERVSWRVRLWTDLGETAWSEPGSFETGLLAPGDWRARWIGPVDDHRHPAGQRPAPLLRGEFEIPRPVVSARLHATALGIYEAFLNGSRVGDAELTPGFTQYDSRLQVQTHDVTALVRTGSNALGAIIADGWYRGQIGITRAADQWAPDSACCAS